MLKIVTGLLKKIKQKKSEQLMKSNIYLFTWMEQLWNGKKALPYFIKKKKTF